MRSLPKPEKEAVSQITSYTYQGHDGLLHAWAESGSALATMVWDSRRYLQERS